MYICMHACMHVCILEYVYKGYVWLGSYTFVDNTHS
jgi:hypothetical protein